MKVELNCSAFAEAVSWAARIIPTKPAVPVLSGIKLEASQDSLHLSVFDYEKSARNEIAAQTEETGTVVVAGKLLESIAKLMPGETVTLNSSGSNLTVESGKSKFTLQLMPESEYPQLPEIPKEAGQVDADTFANAVSQVSVAAAKDETRPVLASVRMEFKKDEIILTSTDRYRLAQARFKWTPTDPDIDAMILISGSTLKDISRTFDIHQNISFGFDAEKPNIISFSNAGRISTVQIIEGEFPQVEKLLALKHPIEAVVERKTLIGALRRASIVADTGTQTAVWLTFSSDELSIVSGEAGDSQATEAIKADLDGDGIRIGFNPAFLLEGLNAINEPYLRFKVTDPTTLAQINGQQEADSDNSEDYAYIIVPVREM